jgi:hypothetical protein
MAERVKPGMVFNEPTSFIVVSVVDLVINYPKIYPKGVV